jgi:uncharacterized protein (DUF58 family)
LADPRLDRHPVPVRWAPSAHARRLLTLAIGALVLAFFTRRPEFAGLAAPPLILLATWRTDRPAEISLGLDGPHGRVVERDEAAVLVSLAGQGAHDAELTLLPVAEIFAGPTLTVPADRNGDPEGSPATVRLRFRAARWGRRRPGTLEIVLRDRARLAEGTVLVELAHLDCAPLSARLDGAILLSKLQSRLGEHPARVPGDGGEFDGVREFVPGDRQRRINWAATTRRGTLHLTTFAAERTQNVVVIADVTFDIGTVGLSTHDLALRGAAGVISRYTASRDRIGLVSYGLGVGWVAPGQGRRHLERLMELLVSGPSGARPDTLARLPRAALPPGALIVAFSPLLDQRFIEAIRDLRERGFSVLVVDVLSALPEHDSSALSGLTARLWKLEQEAMRYSLTQIGVPVAHWDGKAPLDEPLAPYLRRKIVVRR